MNLAGKRVLVTGGTRGIGRATPDRGPGQAPGSSPGQAFEAFLAAGARVAVNGSSAASVAAALAGLGTAERAVAAPSRSRPGRGLPVRRRGGGGETGDLPVAPTRAGRAGEQRRRRRARQADRTGDRGGVGL